MRPWMLRDVLRVLLCDDDPGFRALIRTLVDDERDMQVVGEACDGMDCVEKIPDLRPDVVVLDLSMPRMNGLDALPKLLEAAPRAKVLVLSAHPAERLKRAAVKLGATAYVEKGWSPTALPGAIREAAGIAA